MNKLIHTEYTRYAENLVLSAIAPETIVAAVAQNTVWKNNVAYSVIPLSSNAASDNFENQPVGIPRNPPTDLPYIKP